MWFFSPAPSRKEEIDVKHEAIMTKLNEILDILRTPPIFPPPRTSSPMIVVSPQPLPPPPPSPEILQIPMDMYEELKIKVAQRRMMMGDSMLYTYQ